MNIAIVGCGNIGRRHLQSLIKLCQEFHSINVFVADLDYAQQEITREFFKDEGGDERQISFSRYVETIRNTRFKKIDLAIIATDANNRLKAFQSLVGNCQVKSVIFEKFLFNRPQEYIETASILKIKNIRGWVNTPRRIMPDYQTLLHRLKGMEIDVVVKGPNWGLASNSIHFLSLFADKFPVDKIKVEIDGMKVIKTKREGYNDFVGQIKIEARNNKLLMISTERNKGKKNLLTIITENEFIEIDEDCKGMVIEKKETGEREESKFDFKLQSELTRDIAFDIMRTTTCNLPSYQESMGLHLVLLKSFQEAGLLCQIT